MAWDQLDINKPHLVYLILGAFTSLFMLCSSIIKERLYIGEATVATICGIIFGPHAANLINPLEWGNTDQITLEFSRIVLVVQCFAVGVELPKAYMERHWKSVTFLLIPVMTFGWLVTSLFIWAVFNPTLNWLDSLCIAACVTATDPVLASSVVGKGKFAKRVPKHLRDLLSAESGCNDGMAFPFIYLALYLIKYRPNASEVAYHWICYTILYECIFGCFYGVMVGYIARRAVRYTHEKGWIDRESFLVFYFVLALFCAGSGSLLGMDDLLVGFACGVGFSNDGWFTEKTEESHVSNVIDLLINLAFFVYFGTIIPWAQMNSGILQLDVWRLVVVGLLVLFFRRIPIMLLLKPIIPDIKTWREALFAGHFGPIGVGAIFVAILARGELETDYETTTPLAVLPEPPFPHLNIIELIWPITCFLVICSIVVHGSSVAVFTLGKHINTLTLTMSYTQANDMGPSWMERLPRIQSRSRSSMRSETSFDDEKDGGIPPGELPPVARPGNFLRRQKEEDNPSRAQSRASSRHRSKRSKRWESGAGPGGPVSQSAIAPAPRRETEETETRSDSDTLAVKSETPPSREGEGPVSPGEIYEEGRDTVYEDEAGSVLEVEHGHNEDPAAREAHEREEAYRLTSHEHAEKEESGSDQGPKGESAAAESKVPERPGKNWRTGMNKMSTFTGIRGLARGDGTPKPPKAQPERKNGPARAYQYGNTIIVEDEDGEVIKKYDIPAPDRKQSTAENDRSQKRVGQMSRMLGLGNRDTKTDAVTPGPSTDGKADPLSEIKVNGKPMEEDDPLLRFTISANGRRMSKAEFIDEIRGMDPKSRAQVVENSDAPEPVKREARKDAREQTAALKKQKMEATVPTVQEQPESPVAHRGSEAALHQVNSHDSDDALKLVDSNNAEVPFHDVSADLRKAQGRSTGGETAAQRRRQALLQKAPANDDSDDDGTERVPPSRRNDGPSNSKQRPSEGETAAERRRREGALGLRKEDDSESDEEPQPAPVTHRQGIKFAEGVSPTQERQRQSALKWGKNVGR